MGFAALRLNPTYITATDNRARTKKGHVPINCCVQATTGFGFTPSHFLFACAKEKVTKEKAHPASGFRCAKLIRFAHPAGQPSAVTPLRYVSLVPALFRGSSRWAILGPSFLIWHPCQMPLYTAPPLGLLTGQGIAAPANIVGAVLTAKLLIRQPTHQRWRQA